ncbi:hypothetical protein Tco_0001801 [Tanacetum coccineum]
MSNNGGEADQDEDKELARERDLLASLIEKLKCEIDKRKGRNKLSESLNKTLVDKLKSEIEDFKNKTKCLKSSNNHFKEANTELAKNNQLKLKDPKKFQAKLDRYHDVNYASNVDIDYVKAKGDLISYKFFVKPKFHKKAQRANPLLCDIGCYNDNLALVLAPESDEMIRLAKEKEMVADLRFNSLEHEVYSVKYQLETQRTRFLNEIDRLSKEYYYTDHMNVILGVYTTLDEFTDLQCDYLDQLVKCERLEKGLSKRAKNVNNKSFNELSKRFSELEQHSINIELALQQS